MDDRFDAILSRRLALFADPLDDSDWLDVLRRAPRSSPSRSRAAVGVLAAASLVVAGVIAAPGWGLGSRLIDLFSGEPASPDVQQAVHASDVGAPPGMAPGIEAEKTHKLITIRLADGRQETLWVAPSKSGGLCVYLQRGEPASPGAGCGPSEPPANRILWGLQGRAEHDTTVVLYGQVQSDVTSLRLTYADETTTRLPLTKGFFLYEIPASHFAERSRPSLLVGENGSGEEVAHASLRPVFSYFGMFPGDHRRPPGS
jgi:hypothetical protein